MRDLIGCLALACGLALAIPARAEEIASAYSDLDLDTTCTRFAAAPEGEGDWANFACAGFKGHPVLVFTGDLRQSVIYGFPPSGDLAPAWESFSGFNSTGPRIEWRVSRTGDVEIPFATIHRWFVSDPDDEEDKIEVLVVEKVAHPGTADGCAVGYVVASGNPDANENARTIADQTARDFECGADQPTLIPGAVPVPDFVRESR